MRDCFATSLSRMPRRHGARARAFTLVELIVVIVLLALLAGFAMQKYINYTSQARESSDRSSIAAIQSALSYAFVDHRLQGTAPGSWITTVGGIASTMDPPMLPNGIVISGSQLVDQRGNFYDFVAESVSGPARVQLAAGSPGP